MKLSQIEVAENARRDLRESEGRQRDLKGYRVVGFTIARDGDAVTGTGTISFHKHSSGTGSLSSIGFPDDLASYLNLAVEKWIAERIKDAEARLETLGVDIQA